MKNRFIQLYSSRENFFQQSDRYFLLVSPAVQKLYINLIGRFTVK